MFDTKILDDIVLACLQRKHNGMLDKFHQKIRWKDKDQVCIRQATLGMSLCV